MGLLSAFTVVVGTLVAALLIWWTSGSAAHNLRLELLELIAHAQSRSNHHFMSSLQTLAVPDSVTILAMSVFAVGALVCMYVDVVEISGEKENTITNAIVESKAASPTLCLAHDEDKTAVQIDSIRSQLGSDVSHVAHVSLRCVLFSVFGTLVILTLVSLTMGGGMIRHMSTSADTVHRFDGSDIQELELSVLAVHKLQVSSGIVPNAVVKVLSVFCIACAFVTTYVDARDVFEEELQKSQNANREVCLQECKKQS